MNFVDKVDRSGQTLLVRARHRDDIEEVFPLAKFIEDGGTDYQYRARGRREQVALRLADEVCGLTYSNFKSSVTELDRHDVYVSVWQVKYRYQKDA